MRLTIEHRSCYHYESPVTYALQRLRLTPRNCATQEILAWQVKVEGAEQDCAYTDAFGNHVQLIHLAHAAHEILITASGQVETKESHGVLGKEHCCTPKWVFLRETPLTLMGESMTSFAQQLTSLPVPPHEQLSFLHELMNKLGKKMVYTSGVTDVSTSAETAFTAGQGVCQDLSHVFIALARYFGIPARYVSGYLMMPKTTEQTATHAWAEAYVDDLGWTGFDVANGIAPDQHYVRIACGLDYHDVAPVSGIRSGQGNETLTVNLHVAQQ